MTYFRIYIHGWKTKPEKFWGPEPENRGWKIIPKPESVRTETCGYPTRNRPAAILKGQLVLQPPLQMVFLRTAGDPATLRNIICKGSWKHRPPLLIAFVRTAWPAAPIVAWFVKAHWEKWLGQLSLEWH